MIRAISSTAIFSQLQYVVIHGNIVNLNIERNKNSLKVAAVKQ